jgi:hypothetical protein
MTTNPTRHVTGHLRGKHGRPRQLTRVLVARDTVSGRSFRGRRLAKPPLSRATRQPASVRRKVNAVGARLGFQESNAS